MPQQRHEFLLHGLVHGLRHRFVRHLLGNSGPLELANRQALLALPDIHAFVAAAHRCDEGAGEYFPLAPRPGRNSFPDLPALKSISLIRRPVPSTEALSLNGEALCSLISVRTRFWLL
jgi:hypothetical protein